MAASRRPRRWPRPMSACWSMSTCRGSPSDMPDNPATWWAHIDVDAEKRNFPMWTFPGNLRLPGDSHRILSDLLAALKANADAGFKTRAAARVAKLAEEGKTRREQAAKLAANRGSPGEISPHFVCAALAKALKPSDIVLNEAIRNGPGGVRPDAAHRARHPGRPGGRRAGLLRRHGAGAEARPARAHRGADRRATAPSTSPTRNRRRRCRGSTSCRSSPSCSTTPAGPP